MAEITTTQIENWAKENASKYEEALKKLAKGQEEDDDNEEDDRK